VLLGKCNLIKGWASHWVSKIDDHFLNITISILHFFIQRIHVAFLQLLEQDLEFFLAKVKKFTHLSCLVAMIIEIQHFSKTSSTPIVMIDLMPRL
jgi:hypothetical protein